MTTIDNANNYCTLINVFSVQVENQAELLEVLKTATQDIMCKMPGFISANLHVSDDKKTITNYAQWATMSDFKNMMGNEQAQEHMKKAAGLCQEFKPVLYTEIWSEGITDRK